MRSADQVRCGQICFQQAVFLFIEFTVTCFWCKCAICFIVTQKKNRVVTLNRDVAHDSNLMWSGWTSCLRAARANNRCPCHVMSTTSTLRSVRPGGSLCRRPSRQSSLQWSARSASPADCKWCGYSSSCEVLRARIVTQTLGIESVMGKSHFVVLLSSLLSIHRTFLSFLSFLHQLRPTEKGLTMKAWRHRLNLMSDRHRRTVVVTKPSEHRIIEAWHQHTCQQESPSLGTKRR